MCVGKQRAGGAHSSHSVVVAGVEGPVCFQPPATGNPVAWLRMQRAGACAPLPVPLFAAGCVWVGTLHSLKALGVAVRLLGVDVDVHAVCAATAVSAHNWQAIALKGRWQQMRINQMEVVSTDARSLWKEKAAWLCENLLPIPGTFLGFILGWQVPAFFTTGTKGSSKC